MNQIKMQIVDSDQKSNFLKFEKDPQFHLLNDKFYFQVHWSNLYFVQHWGSEIRLIIRSKYISEEVNCTY